MDSTRVRTARESRAVFHDLSAAETEPRPCSADVGLPERIGGFEVVRRVGRGGMGTVYEAEQTQPRRKVALKVMRFGTTSRHILDRFESESQVLARLKHPGIAQVFAAGTHQPCAGDGGIGPVPFFAMEFVAGGRPITEYADSNDLSIRERLELFVRVADAVEHGHQHGVIHRDLKPANILVDHLGQPKIIDFGVARSVEPGASVKALRTEKGQLLGTVQYMSPEQCDADPGKLDTRSDVYALGVVLYELLCGRLPYDVREAPLHEATRIVKEEAPDRPSTGNVALAGDLETIVLKLLEKDRERRYASAAELKADIERFLRNEAIRARPPSALHQLRLFARRNRALFTSFLAFLAVLVLSLVVITSLYLDVGRALAAQQAAEREACAERQAAAETHRELESLRAMLAGLLLDGGASRPAASPPAGAPPVSDGLPDTRPAAFLSDARRSLERLEPLTTGDPELRLSLALGYEVLGDALAAGRRDITAETLAAYERSLALAQDVERLSAERRVHGVAAAQPAGHGLLQDRKQEGAVATGNGPRLDHFEGRLLAKLNRPEQALATLAATRERVRDRVFADPADPRAVLELACVAFDLGSVRSRLGDRDGAAAEYRQVAAVLSAAGQCALGSAARGRPEGIAVFGAETATDR